MPNQWFRMYSEFATDPKVQMLPEADQRRYLMLLCLRCSNGDVTLHDEEIAFQLRISCDDWGETKARLVAKKLIDEQGRPCAWDKRQYQSDSSTARVAAHRARKKQETKRGCNVSETPPDTETDTEKEKQRAQAGTHTGARIPDPPPPDQPPPPPPEEIPQGIFVMTPDWQPDKHTLKVYATRAGVPMDAFTDDRIGDFVINKSSKAIPKSHIEWVADLVAYTKRGLAMSAKNDDRGDAPNFDDQSWRHRRRVGET